MKTQLYIPSMRNTIEGEEMDALLLVVLEFAAILLLGILAGYAVRVILDKYWLRAHRAGSLRHHA